MEKINGLRKEMLKIFDDSKKGEFVEKIAKKQKELDLKIWSKKEIGKIYDAYKRQKFIYKWNPESTLRQADRLFLKKEDEIVHCFSKRLGVKRWSLTFAYTNRNDIKIHRCDYDIGAYSNRCSWHKKEYEFILKISYENILKIKILHGVPTILLGNHRAIWLAVKGGYIVIEKGWYVKGYHIPYEITKSFEKAIAIAKRHQRARLISLLANKINWKQFQDVLVKYEDAIAAGNCPAGVENFANKYNLDKNGVPIKDIPEKDNVRVMATIKTAIKNYVAAKI